MMLLLMLIMMLKFCVKESSNLIGLENFGAAGFSLQPICVSVFPISQKVIKSLPTLALRSEVRKPILAPRPKP